MAFLGVYGHVNIDTIILLEELPERNHTVPALGEIDRLGGTGGTIARTAAKLGVPTALAAFVGEDFPDEYRKMLTDLEIDVTDLKTRPGRTAHCWLLSVPGGDSSCVIDQGVYRAEEPLPLLDYTLLNSDWVHVTTGDPTMHLEVVREARRAGKNVVFDPAQELHYRYDDRLFERFLDASDVFICNKTEFGHALGKLGYGDVEQLFDHVETVIVTRGADGLAVHAKDGVVDVPPCPVRGTHRPETTGAGDVFRGGLYAGLHAGKELAEAARWGAVASSLFLESEGARLPKRDEVEARLAAWATEAEADTAANPTG